MLLFIGGIINQLFGNTAHAVMSAAEAKLKRETVGKVEAKVMGAQLNMQQNALRAVNQVGTGPNRQSPRS